MKARKVQPFRVLAQEYVTSMSRGTGYYQNQPLNGCLGLSKGY